MISTSVIKEIQRKVLNVIEFHISNNKEAVKFLLVFASFSITFFLIFFLLQDNLDFLLIWTAHITGSVSNLLGVNVAVNDVILSFETMDFEIIHECTGIFAIMIIVSSIVAYPTQWKKKTIGILFVIPLILLLNLIRILFLIYIGKYHTDLFEVVHSYLWQGTFIIFIILAWFLWIELVVNRER